MPEPNPGESQDDFVKRCIPIVIDDGTAKDGKQAFAICTNMYTHKAAPTKNGLPASCFLVVEDPAQVSTWHLPVKNADGTPNHGNMGAAHAALLSPSGFRGQKYQGPGKTEAIRKLKKLYEAEGMAWPEGKSFRIFKQADGSYRWVLISSSTFRDRDGEIVTGKALADDIERCDTVKDYGPLRWWHLGGWEAPDGIEQWQTWRATPGVDLGTCDFNMLHGKLLIESGTFKDAVTGEAFAQAQDELEVSLGFSHPPDEPTKDKQYLNIHRFERSLMPAGWASNLLTRTYVITKGENNMKTSEKLAALVALLRGNKEAVQQILSDSEKVQKAAEEAGLEYKEVEELLADPVEAEAELPTELETKPEEVIPPSAEAEAPAAEEEPKAVETQAAEKVAPAAQAAPAQAAPAPAPAQVETIGSMTPQQLADFVVKVVQQLGAKKENDPVEEAVKALSAQVKEITDSLAEQKQSLLDITDSRPVGIKRLQQMRPSERDDNVSQKAAPAGPTIDPDFRTFTLGGK